MGLTKENERGVVEKRRLHKNLE